MLEAFKEGHVLHIKYAWPLIKEAKEVFAKESTLQVRNRRRANSIHSTLPPLKPKHRLPRNMYEVYIYPRYTMRSDYIATDAFSHIFPFPRVKESSERSIAPAILIQYQTDEV